GFADLFGKAVDFIKS
nr:RecName: Full=Signiferin-4.2 [Crinia signifera]